MLFACFFSYIYNFMFYNFDQFREIKIQERFSEDQFSKTLAKIKKITEINKIHLKDFKSKQ